MRSTELPFLPLVFQILQRQKLKMILTAILVMGATVLFTALTQRTYRSEAKVLVRVGRENTTVDATATLGQNQLVTVPLSREMEINSVLEVLSSRNVLEKVVDSVGTAAILGDAPAQPLPTPGSQAPEPPDHSSMTHFRAIVALQQALKMEAVKRSNVIWVGCEASSPQTAQAIVDRLIDFATDQHMILNRTPGSYKFLAEQAARLETQVRRTEDELRTLKDKTGIIAPEARRQVLVTRIGRLEDDLLQAQSSLTSVEAEVAAMEKKLQSFPRTHVLATLRGVPNAGADQMRSQLYTLQVREVELLGRHAEQHPEVILIRKQTAAAKELLAAEEASRDQVTTGPNRVHEELAQALVRQQTQATAFKSRVEALEQQLKQEREEMKTFTANEIQIARLQRRLDLDVTQQRKYAENLEQGQIDQALQSERISNISNVQSGTFDPKPIRPRWGISLGFGAILALTSSIAVALLAQYGPSQGTSGTATAKGGNLSPTRSGSPPVRMHPPAIWGQPASELPSDVQDG